MLRGFYPFTENLAFDGPDFVLYDNGLVITANAKRETSTPEYLWTQLTQVQVHAFRDALGLESGFAALDTFYNLGPGWYDLGSTRLGLQYTEPGSMWRFTVLQQASPTYDTAPAPFLRAYNVVKPHNMAFPPGYQARSKSS